MNFFNVLHLALDKTRRKKILSKMTKKEKTNCTCKINFFKILAVVTSHSLKKCYLFYDLIIITFFIWRLKSYHHIFYQSHSFDLVRYILSKIVAMVTNHGYKNCHFCFHTMKSTFFFDDKTQHLPSCIFYQSQFCSYLFSSDNNCIYSLFRK